jgi:hypothetical protein
VAGLSAVGVNQQSMGAKSMTVHARDGYSGVHGEVSRDANPQTET